jgi:hypothetical protein
MVLRMEKASNLDTFVVPRDGGKRELLYIFLG